MTPPGPARAVLLVEDVDGVRHAVAELLTLQGHRVEAVATGAEALARAAASVPEVALIDLGLPDLDGLEVARRLRARHGAGPFLVALTGAARESDRRAALEAGFDLHLAKPVDPAALERLVARGRDG
ncbi:MAG: response regulator [Anaeromyxobacter sp.]|nr:response regulator [Anaeromyxobacter sp.]MBL0278529.1 response regulator [Anaeromyxobacter sp.]